MEINYFIHFYIALPIIILVYGFYRRVKLRKEFLERIAKLQELHNEEMKDLETRMEILLKKLEIINKKK